MSNRRPCNSIDVPVSQPIGPTNRAKPARAILLFLLLVLIWWDPVGAELRFPPLTGRVVDLADLLSPAAEQELSDKLAAHEAATSNQIVIVTLSDLQGLNIADYGYQLGRDWGIGSKEHNNGALLIVAPMQRKVRIEVGYGLEGALTDALSRAIIEGEILPHFKTGDMAGGIAAGTEAVLRAVAGEYKAPEGAQESPAGKMYSNDPYAFLGLTAVIGGILGGLARARRWTGWVVLAMLPIAAAGASLAGLSPVAEAAEYFSTVLLLSIMGLSAFLVIAFGESAHGSGGIGHDSGGFGRGRTRLGRSGSSGGGFGGGFGGGGGSFGGGGASGSW